MTIAAGDIRILKAQTSTDTDDGGGPATANQVIDGQSNNLFNDISELDRAYGRVSLRKVFPSVFTTNTDTLFGTHMLVSRLPHDENVQVCLFTTKDWFDRRTSAQNNIESYLALGPKWAGHLLETQLAGQRAIQIALQVGDPTPTAGQGLALIQNQGLVNEYSQYVRAKRVSEVTQNFTVAGNTTVARRVVTIEISDPLLLDYTGLTVAQFYSNVAATGVLRDTRVADAATYYGSRPLAVDAALDSATVQADTIFTSLVPSATSETPMVDLAPSGQSSTYVAGSTSAITVSIATNTNTNSSIYLASPILPNTLSFTLFGQDVVDGGGVLKAGSTEIGAIEYDKGLLRFNSNVPLGSGTVAYTFMPAAAPAQIALSAYTQITAINRGFNYVETFTPIPSAGSMVLSYIAQGKVYYLRDNGIGQLKGADSAFGSGTLNYSTGTLLLTLGVLPDVGTEILYQWGAGGDDTFVRSGNSVQPLQVYLQSTHTSIQPSSTTVTWLLGGVTKTATDNGLGAMTGDGTGTINYAEGLIKLKPNVLPPVGTQFTLAVTSGTRLGVPETVASVGAGTHSYTLAGSDPVVPRSVSISMDLVYQGNVKSVKVVDSPVSGDTGNLVIEGYGTVVGTIDYTTRIVEFSNPTLALSASVKHTKSRKWWKFAGAQTWYTIETVNYTFQGGDITTYYRTGTAASTTSETFTANELISDVTDGLSESIVAGSVRLTIGSKVYVDRLGLLYHSISTTTNAGTFAGSIQLGTGRISITGWDSGITNAVTLTSLVTRVGIQQMSVLAFRTPIVPLRAQSLQILGTFSEGGTFNVTADSSGYLVSTYVNGFVDTVTGMATLEFGQRYEINAGNRATIEAQPWYHISLEYDDGGVQKIFEPKFVQADTLGFNAVGLTYLPLSEEILGLSTVRLPSDGRVPIFRVGGVVVLTSTKTYVMPTATAGTTYTTGDVRLSTLELVDDEGTPVPTDKYDYDLVAGTATLHGDFSVGTLATPLKINYRYQDMALATDVQISGVIALSRTLTHAYDSSDSIVSSALIVGDSFSRYYNLFSQGVWSTNWLDTREGAVIAAQYNDVLYPLVVSNKGAIQERWALVFTSNTTYRIIGQSSGQIGTGDTATDIAPTNPANGEPYFTIPSAGWGSGWVTGNTLRFNTVAATYPVWVARTVLQGPATDIDDKFELQVRGDIDRP